GDSLVGHVAASAAAYEDFCAGFACAFEQDDTKPTRGSLVFPPGKYRRGKAGGASANDGEVDWVIYHRGKDAEAGAALRAAPARVLERQVRRDLTPGIIGARCRTFVGTGIGLDDEEARHLK